MAAYWFMFALPALAMLVPTPATPNLARWFWLTLGLIFTLLIGLRYEVGGDWFSYLLHYSRMVDVPFRYAFDVKDPGYAALNWLSGLVDGKVYLVNLICGAVLMAGIITFARRQPLPLLALLVAIPYLIIVVGMGYTRQSVAMGFELLALVALMDGKLRRFIVLIACGALFHKSAVVLLPLAALASTQRRLWTWTWVGVVSAVLAGLILLESREFLWHHYVDRGRASEGGGIRVAMNAIPSFLFLMYRNRLTTNEYERKLWTWIALFSLACVPLVGLASTAVDRVALYFMPIQMLVFSRVNWLVSEPFYRPLFVWGVVLGYAFVQWIWLNFAGHAYLWVPYEFAPLL